MSNFNNKRNFNGYATKQYGNDDNKNSHDDSKPHYSSNKPRHFNGDSNGKPWNNDSKQFNKPRQYNNESNNTYKPKQFNDNGSNGGQFNNYKSRQFNDNGNSLNNKPKQYNDNWSNDKQSNNKPKQYNETNDKQWNQKPRQDNSTQKDDELLNDMATKKRLLEYIYNTIDLSQYKYKLMEYEIELPLINEKKYYVSPNYNGIHGLLVFIKIKDKFMSFIVDRKTLTYNANQIDYDKVKIIPIYIRLTEEIYNGTIIDGVLLYNNINRMKHFVVNDIYYFRGKNLSSDKITNKMLNIGTYLETIKEDIIMNNITLIVNKLYELADIKQLVNSYIPKSKYNKSIKGLAFYSEYSGVKLLFLYNNGSHDNENDNQVNDDKNTVQKEKTIIIVNKDVQVTTFKMKKTEIVDVYNLYLGEKLSDNGKKLFKYKKIGLAYIPTKECSAYCKNLFGVNDDSILIDCKYDTEKERWVPFKLVTDKKRPDLVNQISNQEKQ